MTWGKLILLMGVMSGCYSQNDDHLGTTPNIKDIFVGRCLEYEEIRYKNVLPSVKTKCSSLWQQFVKAFSYQPPCGVSMESYQPFLEASKQELPKDKVLFWSGVYNLAHQYGDGGQRMVTLEDTLTGYVVNSLTWCGQSISPGLNYSRCPSWSDCPLEVGESFWGAASKAFASGARGNVAVILDGSNPLKPAYSRDSFFGKYELPYLSQQNVTGVDVMIAHTLNATVVNNCQSQSIKQLISDLEARHFKVTCEDNPKSILFLLCSEDPSSRECQAVKSHMMGLLPEQQITRKHFNQKPDDFLFLANASNGE